MAEAIQEMLPLLEAGGEELIKHFAIIVMDPLLKWADERK